MKLSFSPKRILASPALLLMSVLLTGMTNKANADITFSAVLGSNSTTFPGTSGAQTGRVFRDGISTGSECASPKDYPGEFTTTGQYTYDSYKLVNQSSSPTCVSVTLTQTSGNDTALFAVAYNGSFNPISLSQNYLSDSGSSPLIGNPIPLSFTLAAGATGVLVINEVNSGSGVGAGYNISVSGISTAQPPVVSSVTISPSRPTTNSVLTATPVATDPQGDPLTYSFTWMKNGSVIAGENGPTLDLSKSGNGDRGDKITVTVVAKDGTNNSAPFTSSAVTIVNASPVATSVIVTPGNPTTTSVLTATATATDADGDTLSYLYVWKKNGVVIPGETNPTLNLAKAGNGDSGDSITVEAKARDNSSNSNPVTSAPVTVVADVPTSAVPSISSVTLSPTSPKTNDVLKASVAATAADGDSDSLTYSYVWKNNGSVLAGESGSTLDLSKTGNGDKGQTITVEVVASEGAASSSSASASVTVANTVSVPTRVTLSSSTPGTNDVLTATASGFDADGDTFTFVYQWKKNGAVIPGESGQTLNLAKPGNGDAGDTITVEIKTREGNVSSAPLGSTPATVSGTSTSALRFAPSGGKS